MKILVLNSGSSSIKYSLYEMSGMSVLISGAIERIGEKESMHHFHSLDDDGTMQASSFTGNVVNHEQGLAGINRVLAESGIITGLSELDCIGHRVVHGGEMFHQPTLIDESVLKGLREIIQLAPLHNPANLKGIEVALRHAVNVPQVAVFDTAFHQSIPDYAYRYALPVELYKQEKIRRYGFHGTSYFSVARQAAKLLSRPLQSLNLIIMHLGNGASAVAIRNGQSVDTSMGMTPLEGLMMGTRCGDIDPSIPNYLSRNRGMSSAEIDFMLNHQSGLKGICGENDMRSVHKMADDGDENAQLALNIYSYRIKKYIGAYFAVLGRLDALVFTGGIGENDAIIRGRACKGLDHLGIAIDPNKNARKEQGEFDIRRQGMPVGIFVIPTNEEIEIALQSRECIQKQTSLETPTV